MDLFNPDKGESLLACQITFPFNKKMGCFVRQSFKFYFKT